jgi:hypothetical protein
MSLSVGLGLLLALGCAVVALLGSCSAAGAVGAPTVELRPVRSTIALFANRWWTLGIVVATTAWFFHVAALSLARSASFGASSRAGSFC